MKKLSEKLIEEILDETKEQEDFGLKSLELKKPERALDWFEKPREIR